MYWQSLKSRAHIEGGDKELQFSTPYSLSSIKMAAVRALQASRTFTRIALPVHSRTFSRIAVRAPQSLARVGPSSVRGFSVTARVQDGTYIPLLYLRESCAPQSRFQVSEAYRSSLSIQRPQI